MTSLRVLATFSAVSTLFRLTFTDEDSTAEAAGGCSSITVRDWAVGEIGVPRRGLYSAAQGRAAHPGNRLLPPAGFGPATLGLGNLTQIASTIVHFSDTQRQFGLHLTTPPIW